jgi:hypothetical protein
VATGPGDCGQKQLLIEVAKEIVPADFSREVYLHHTFGFSGGLKKVRESGYTETNHRERN